MILNHVRQSQRQPIGPKKNPPVRLVYQQTYQYDLFGRLVGAVEKGSDHQPAFTTRYAYFSNPANLLDSMIND